MFSKITSLQHPLVKHLVKLREDRKYRYLIRSVVLCGLNLIRDLSKQFQFHSIFLQDEFDPGFEFKTENLYRVPFEIIKKGSGLKNPEPIIAEIKMPDLSDLSSANFLLILDGISDPGNLGTLLRTACGLGWNGVFITPRSTDPFNDKAIRAAKGATFTLPWKAGSYQELATLLKRKNMKLYSADPHGKDLSDCQCFTPFALALGNEAHGLAFELREQAEIIAVPMKNAMESLNVASAGAILMYQLKEFSQPCSGFAEQENQGSKKNSRFDKDASSSLTAHDL